MRVLAILTRLAIVGSSASPVTFLRGLEYLGINTTQQRAATTRLPITKAMLRAYATALYGPQHVDEAVESLKQTALLYTDLLPPLASLNLTVTRVHYKQRDPEEHKGCALLEEGWLYNRRTMPDFDLEDAVYVYRDEMVQPVPNDTWVEVTHCYAHASGCEAPGWHYFYRSAGSGVWFNLGKTAISPAHNLCMPGHGMYAFLAYVEQLRRDGYDSVQFYHQSDGVCHGVVSEIISLKWPVRYDPPIRGRGGRLVDRPHQPDANASEVCGAVAEMLRGGWNASLPCRCRLVQSKVMASLNQTAGKAIQPNRQGNTQLGCVRCDQ